MHAIWAILIEFLLRLTFGMAVAMGLTPARWVTSGFFRVHLWVLMGINTFAALWLYSQRAAVDVISPGLGMWLVGLAIASAVISYVGAVIWMYEQNGAGKTAIGLVAASSGLGCWLISRAGMKSSLPIGQWLLLQLDWLPGSLVIGSVTTAMLLGHWYLNSPGMRMEPLYRLLLLIFFALALRGLWSGAGLTAEVLHRTADHAPTTQFWLFVALRWLAGIFGPTALTWLTWLTLKIPNTQSATGILYAGVILVFIGELTSRLMSMTTLFPI